MDIRLNARDGKIGLEKAAVGNPTQGKLIAPTLFHLSET